MQKTQDTLKGHHDKSARKASKAKCEPVDAYLGPETLMMGYEGNHNQDRTKPQLQCQDANWPTALEEQDIFVPLEVDHECLNVCVNMPPDTKGGVDVRCECQ